MVHSRCQDKLLRPSVHKGWVSPVLFGKISKHLGEVRTLLLGSTDYLSYRLPFVEDRWYLTKPWGRLSSFVKFCTPKIQPVSSVILILNGQKEGQVLFDKRTLNSIMGNEQASPRQQCPWLMLGFAVGTECHLATCLAWQEHPHGGWAQSHAFVLTARRDQSELSDFVQRPAIVCRQARECCLSPFKLVADPKYLNKSLVNV